MLCFLLSHFVILAIFVFISVVIFLYRKKLNDDNWKRAELGVTFSLILSEIMNHIWMYVNGIWKVGRSMPLESCNIGLILCVILLLTRKKLIFEILFFIAILGVHKLYLLSFNIRFSTFSIFPLFLCAYDGCMGNFIFNVGKKIIPQHFHCNKINCLYYSTFTCYFVGQ